MTTIQLQYQIKALDKVLSDGKCKNKYALANKITRVKTQLIKEESRNKFLNFLAQ